jgi:transcriptional regulator with PAS, ATPase and Fis domain
MIEPQHLPNHLRPDDLEKTAPLRSSSTLAEAEKWVITEALKRHGWNQTAAALDLDIHRSTLGRKMKSLGIELP